MKKLLLSLALSAIALSTSSRNDETVYICTGPKAEVYHSKSNCRGLNRCSGDVRKVTLSKAIEMGRRACKICY